MKPITFYISQSLKLRETAIELRKLINRVGHNVQAQWIGEPAQFIDGEATDPIGDESLCQMYAQEDLKDVMQSDAFVYFSDHCSYGKNIEFGVALAMAKPIYIIGPHRSVFHYLPNVIEQFVNVEEFIAYLTQHGRVLSPVLRFHSTRR